MLPLVIVTGDGGLTLCVAKAGLRGPCNGKYESKILGDGGMLVAYL